MADITVSKEEWDRVIEMLDQANKAIESAPKWISCKERLPEDKAWVLCKCRAGIYEVLMWIGASWYHDTNHCYMKGFVTHWMPLQEPPEMFDAIKEKSKL